MKRRRFNQLALVGSLSGLSGFSFMNTTTKKKLLPALLKAGDTIGIISPGSAATTEQVEAGVAQVKSLGFKVKRGVHLGERFGYVAGTDEQRLADLHDMFADSKVQGIWCIRGGYGCSRLLPYIDYALIRKNPKALIGYSDITALLQAIYLKTGLIGFHGPNAQPAMPSYTLQQFQSILMNRKSPQEIPLYDHKMEDKYLPCEVIRAGVAKGRLMGGNLSLLASLAGTDYALEAKNKIIFIEDIGEKPYRIDRMLTQLRQTANLKSAAGIVLGQFKNCEAKDLSTSLSLKDCLSTNLKDLGIPVMTGFSFGHVAHNCTLPVGALVELNTSKKSLKVLEEVIE